MNKHSWIGVRDLLIYICQDCNLVIPRTAGIIEGLSLVEKCPALDQNPFQIKGLEEVLNV